MIGDRYRPINASAMHINMFSILALGRSFHMNIRYSLIST